VLKAFKKEFCCNGTVVEDPEQGNVIQLQGDQRKNVSQFLITARARASRLSPRLRSRLLLRSRRGL